MADLPKDSWIPVTVDVADAIARVLTSQRMGVIKASGKTYLTHVDKRTWVNLLPYQMTVGGIRAVVLENDPWPGD